MPVAVAVVLASSNARAGVPSAKRRFPVPNRTGSTSSTTSSARPCSSTVDVSVERAPFQAFWPVGHHVFLRGVEAIRHRTARCLRPEARKTIVGAPAQQQIELLAIPRKQHLSASRGAIWRRPVTVGKIILIGGGLDHAVQRDVFENSELSHCGLP